MKRLAGVSLVLALAMLIAAGAADTAKTEVDLKREARMAADSNSVETPRPQLSEGTRFGLEVPMARETNMPAAPPAAPVEVASPAAAQSRNVWAIILAILVLLVGRVVLKHLRSRSGPS